MRYIQQGKRLIFRLLLLALCAVGLFTGCAELEDTVGDRGSGYQDLVLIEDDDESLPADFGEDADASEGMQGEDDKEEDGLTDAESVFGTAADEHNTEAVEATKAAETEAAKKQETTAASNQKQESSASEKTQAKETTAAGISRKGTYSSPEEVAEYIHRFKQLPSNYITKREAEELGWNSSRGNLWDVAYGKSIGGSRFGNYEGLLPDKSGRKWYECDVNYEGGYRGAERILYSNDGLIYYTNDHYETFTKLY